MHISEKRTSPGIVQKWYSWCKILRHFQPDRMRDSALASSLPPSIVVGVTHPQTCLILGPRLRALRAAGFRVTLVCGPGELAERAAAAAGVDSAFIPMQRGIAPFRDLVSLLRLFWLLRRIRPDGVEFSTPKAGLLGTVAAALCGVRRRVYLLRGLRLEGVAGPKRRVLLAFERLACRCAHLVLSNSASLRAEALALGLAPEDKLIVLGSGSSIGVDTDRFCPRPANGHDAVRERLRIPAGAPVIGFVGRLTRDKGLPELIASFETVARAEPEARLLLVGWFDAAEDALPSALRDKIRNHPRIHCTGFVHDAAPFYRAMDLMVLPTWREGLPNAVLEAQATGIPVVTTLSTGSRDSVVPEVTGLLIPPGHPEAIAEAVLRLLRSPDRRRQMGRAAREWVCRHYSHRRVLGLTVDFYRGLLEPDRESGSDGRWEAKSDRTAVDGALGEQI
jgi:glycosyltransferase involved in cell wall biosynthesis